MGNPALLFCEYNDNAAVTVTDTYSPAGSYAAKNILEPTEDLTHRFLNNTGTKDIVIDQVDIRTLEYVALLGSNLDGISLEVRGSTDNFSSSDIQLLASTALVAAVNAAWAALTTTGNYRYIKLRLSSVPSDLELAHVCCGSLDELPYLDQDWMTNYINTTGRHLISGGGYYVGSTIEKKMRSLLLAPGQLSDAEYLIIEAWAEACLGLMRPFFFVPDTAEDDVFFGWAESGSFSAPRPNGVRECSPINFVTRAG